RKPKTADFTIDQPKLLAHTGFFARFQGYRTILLFGLVHKVPRMRALNDMSVGVDDGILILAVHGSPLFVSISPTLVDRSWSCQSAQALRFASVLCAGSAGNQPSRHGLAFAFEVKLACAKGSLGLALATGFPGP